MTIRIERTWALAWCRPSTGDESTVMRDGSWTQRTERRRLFGPLAVLRIVEVFPLPGSPAQTSEMTRRVQHNFGEALDALAEHDE